MLSKLLSYLIFDTRLCTGVKSPSLSIIGCRRHSRLILTFQTLVYFWQVPGSADHRLSQYGYGAAPLRLTFLDEHERAVSQIFDTLASYPSLSRFPWFSSTGLLFLLLFCGYCFL